MDLENWEPKKKQVNYVIQRKTPKTIKPVPNRAWPTRIFSPSRIPNTAVAANVVALVTGTASEIGAWLKIAKKVADAERLMKKGSEYCQKKSRVIQLDKEFRSFWWILWGGFFGVGVDLRDSSQRSAPRRIAALVAPQIRPTANIFSTSPIMVAGIVGRTELVHLKKSFCKEWVTTNKQWTIKRFRFRSDDICFKWRHY